MSDARRQAYSLRRSEVLSKNSNILKVAAAAVKAKGSWEMQVRASALFLSQIFALTNSTL